MDKIWWQVFGLKVLFRTQGLSTSLYICSHGKGINTNLETYNTKKKAKKNLEQFWMWKRPLFGNIKSQSWARLDKGEMKQLERK